MADEDESLVQAARRRHASAERWRHDGERSFGRSLAMVGAYGWLVVVPAVGGAFLGRWLDGQRGGGIVFTAALVMLGAGAGMWVIWRRMNEE